jgi:hypothetical protein
MIRFHTNLDSAKPYVSRLNYNGHCVPQKGDRVRFGEARTFELEVVSRTFLADSGTIAIELHMPSYDSRSIKEWEAWFVDHMERRP